MSERFEIPKDWTNKRFDKISNVVRGGSPRPAGDPRYFNGTFMPWLTVASLTNIPDSQMEVTQTEGFLTEEGATQSRQLEKGTLILSNSGATLGVAKILGIHCCANDGIAAFINWNENEVDKFYACYFLNSKTKYFRDVVAPGNGQPNLNTDLIGIEHIHYPPLSEQKAIAKVLSTADAAIHTTQKLIAQKELRKKWLMQQLLTGKKRMKGLGGEWKKLGAGEIFKSITKKGFADEELLSATQDRGMIPRTMLEGRVTMPTTGTEGFKLVEIGDFVISLRSFQGGLEYSFYRGLVSPAYTVLKPTTDINEEFYKQYFKSYEFIGRLATAVIGIRDGKQISYDDFCIVKIPNPSIEEQTAIAHVLQAADKEISLLKAKAEKLREQKKGLMQVLLTGKVRLKINE
ncbi:restriction endonuclease subunit S [Algoriphagus jejuensis]